MLRSGWKLPLCKRQARKDEDSLTHYFAMKKFCSLIIACLAALCATAQDYENFTLGEGQYIIGNSTSDDYAEYGSAPYNGDVLVGAIVPSSSYKNLRNCKAIGIRFCVPEAVEVKYVTLHGHDIDVEEQNYVQKPTEPIVKGWNYVAFDSPQTIDPEGCFISYTYVQTSTNYGICNWPDLANGGFWIYLYNTDTKKWTWGNFSPYYGAACIQLIVQAEVSEYDVTATDVVCNPTTVGGKGKAIVYLRSDSSKDIEDIDFSISIDGKTSTVHNKFSKPVAAGINRQFGIEVEYDVPETAGEYPVTFTLNEANGHAFTSPSTIDFTQSVYTRLARRRTVVEEFTGTGCGYCPRGWVGMEYLKANREDFIGVAVHKYNESDPMYCNRYCNPGFGGAPTCVVDRQQTLDPYFGSGNGIDADFDYFQSIAPVVDVKVQGTFSADMKKVAAEAEVEFLGNTGKFTIAYVLTADDLHRNNGTWMQTNYYNGQDFDESKGLPHMPDLREFYKNGKYAKAAMLTFNDVLIGSSYSTTGSNYAKTLGATQHKAGDVVTNTYNCSINAKDEVLSVIDYNKVYVVALVIDTDGHIANAARAQVMMPDGINTVLAEPACDAENTYDLSGRHIAAPGKGLNIVGGKKKVY